MCLKLLIFNLFIFKYLEAKSKIPIVNLDPKNAKFFESSKIYTYFPFKILMDQNNDTSEFWTETDILSLVRKKELNIDYEKCKATQHTHRKLYIPARRLVRPICKGALDFQQCPQCPRLTNFTECELFRDSCRERRILPSEYSTYCDKKYRKWRTKFFAADYSQCQCCDECVFYRELDQSCIADEYSFDSDEFLPVTTIDFRAGCNPYLGHPEQEMRALRCDSILRRCVPISIPPLPNETLHSRHSFRFESLADVLDCPVSCRGYDCQSGFVKEKDCIPGAFLSNKDQCNCCGKCSLYFQLNQKCAEYKNTAHETSVGNEIEVEEEFLEPGCDDGLVCREGVCQDIHTLAASVRGRRSEKNSAYEPCREELKRFIKKYGKDGHLHYDAPQCTPLWLYAPIQCRRFVCYCSLEDGTFIEGIKVPRIEVSNMNCDCAREKCRTGSDVQCDGYGNYADRIFYVDWSTELNDTTFIDETK